MTDPKHEERVHTVCEYMKRVRGESTPCKECPRSISVMYYGKDQQLRRSGQGQQLCRSLAEEVMSVVIHGVPHRSGWNPIPCCPHGYTLANLADGTDSCEGCDSLKE